MPSSVGPPRRRGRCGRTVPAGDARCRRAMPPRSPFCLDRSPREAKASANVSAVSSAAVSGSSVRRAVAQQVLGDDGRAGEGLWLGTRGDQQLGIGALVGHGLTSRVRPAGPEDPCVYRYVPVAPRGFGRVTWVGRVDRGFRFHGWGTVGHGRRIVGWLLLLTGSVVRPRRVPWWSTGLRLLGLRFGIGAGPP